MPRNSSSNSSLSGNCFTHDAVDSTISLARRRRCSDSLSFESVSATAVQIAPGLAILIRDPAEASANSRTGAVSERTSAQPQLIASSIDQDSTKGTVR